MSWSRDSATWARDSKSMRRVTSPVVGAVVSARVVRGTGWAVRLLIRFRTACSARAFTALPIHISILKRENIKDTKVGTR